MYPKVEDVKRPLRKGEFLLVPCIIKRVREYWLGKTRNLTYITPVINHPHNDIENGQKEIHYHADFRFIKTYGIAIQRNHRNHIFCEDIRPVLDKYHVIEYLLLPVVNSRLTDEVEQTYQTNVNLMKKSKLKHDCIYKGKCPHRGYDLSQERPRNGIITCPLHGLQFDEQTGKVLNFEK
jgi:hypothetical protein